MDQDTVRLTIQTIMAHMEVATPDILIQIITAVMEADTAPTIQGNL
jgi:hypothetical protein